MINNEISRDNRMNTSQRNGHTLLLREVEREREDKGREGNAHAHTGAHTHN